jgi:hypothetical protein
MIIPAKAPIYLVYVQAIAPIGDEKLKPWQCESSQKTSFIHGQPYFCMRYVQSCIRRQLTPDYISFRKLCRRNRSFNFTIEYSPLLNRLLHFAINLFTILLVYNYTLPNYNPIIKQLETKEASEEILRPLLPSAGPSRVHQTRHLKRQARAQDCLGGTS